MVIKRDRSVHEPRKVKQRWEDWFIEFLGANPEASVADYLQWCRDEFPLSEHRARMAKRVEGNPHFKRMVAKHRQHQQFLKAEPEVVRRMSGKQLYESYVIRPRGEGALLGERGYYATLMYQCERLSLSPLWQDFIQSHALFDEGSAGHHLLQNPIVNYWVDYSTRLFTIRVAIDLFFDMDEFKEAIPAVVARGQERLYGVKGSKLRPLGFNEFDERYLFYELADTYNKTYNEIIAMVKRCQRTGTIDPTIKQVYPDNTEEEIAKFLRGLSSYNLSYEAVHSAVRHTKDRLALREIRPALPRSSGHVKGYQWPPGTDSPAHFLS